MAQTPDYISRLAFLLYPHLAAEGDHQAAETLANRIKAIQKGLLPEDEFSAMVCWLGNCAGIHRIDQTPMPVVEMPEQMRAPDFIAFPVVDGKRCPVLIEVKSSHDRQLDWSEGYLLSLKRFAAHLNLPLLVAWKCGDLWTLVDVEHFEKNVTAYRLTLGKALTEDLLCVLFRNLRIQMNPDLEFRLEFRILDEVAIRPDGVMPEGNYRMEVAKAGFHVDGKDISTHPPEHFWLFLSAPQEDSFERIDARHCLQTFRPLAEHGFTLSNVLVSQLSFGNEGNIDWHTILTKPFPSSGKELRGTLQAALDNDFIRYVMDIIPRTWPSFLPEQNKLLNNR